MSNDTPVREIDLLDSSAWPRNTETRGGKLTRGPYVYTLLGPIEALRGGAAGQDIDTNLERAISALQALPPDCRLTDPQASAASEVINNLIQSLEAGLLGDDNRPEVLKVIESYRNPENLVEDLIRSCVTFSAHLAIEKRDAVATFSLILFRSSDHGGKIKQSFNGDRFSWAKALMPDDGSAPDRHLAVIPPPDASLGIEKLAKQLGIDSHLPCVLFLGRQIPISGSDPLFLNQNVRLSDFSKPTFAEWTCFSLHTEPPTYPDQLRKIYKTVYSPEALGPGERVSAAADLIKDKLLAKINPVAVAKIFAGALVGPGAVAAIDAGGKLFSM